MVQFQKNKWSSWILMLTIVGGFQPLTHAASPVLSTILKRTGKMKRVVSYDGVIYSNADVVNEDQTFKHTSHMANAFIPIYQSKRFSLATNVKYGANLFTTGRGLPARTPAREFPGFLVESGISLHSQFRMRSGGEWSFGFGAGSARDRFLPSGRDVVLDGMISRRWRLSKRASLYTLVHFSNNRNYLNLIPLPGIMYRIAVSRKLFIMAGYPMSAIVYRPVRPIRIALSAILADKLEFSLGYRIERGEEFFLEAVWDHEGYMLEDRVEDSERLIIDEKRVVAGVKSALFDWMILSLKAGVSFLREANVAESIFSDRVDGFALAPSLYAAARVEFRF
jgi:hypothetical protein